MDNKLISLQLPRMSIRGVETESFASKGSQSRNSDGTQSPRIPFAKDTIDNFVDAARNKQLVQIRKLVIIYPEIIDQLEQLKAVSEEKFNCLQY